MFVAWGAGLCQAAISRISGLRLVIIERLLGGQPAIQAHWGEASHPPPLAGDLKVAPASPLRGTGVLVGVDDAEEAVLADADHVSRLQFYGVHGHLMSVDFNRSLIDQATSF